MSLAPAGSQTFASLASDPIPFVRGLSQLIRERRLAAILTRTDRASERRRCPHRRPAAGCCRASSVWDDVTAGHDDGRLG